MKKYSLFAVVVLALAVGSCHAAIPGRINYQGKLTDSSGKLVADGSYSMTFKLFDALTGGTEKWSETHTGTVAVTNGLFNVMLGCSPTCLSSVFQANDSLWLQITIGAETFAPRQQLASAGYALRADYATNMVDLDSAQTLANKTLTSPVITNATISFNAPQGYLINGKIVPSVASNSLTVALKGINGSDPSAANPVYCRIGDVVRSITAPLSVTAGAADNACNATAAELVNKEIDYFVYLFFKASDSTIKIGFSRIPDGHIASDFGSWSAEKGIYDKPAMGIAASDTGELIGRFAATTSGSAWTVPAFTATNLIQRPIDETRWLRYDPVYTGFSTNPTRTHYYKIFGDQCHITSIGLAAAGAGVSNSIDYYETLPILYVNGADFKPDNTYDNSAIDNGNLAVCRFDGNIMRFLRQYANGSWTSSNNKVVGFSHIYRIR